MKDIFQMKVFNSILTIMTGHVSYEVSYVVESQYDWARPIFLERILDRVLKRPASRKGTWPTGVNESVRGCVAILSKRIGRTQSY